MEETKLTCNVEGCAEDFAIQVTRAERRTRIQQESFCESHGREFMRRYLSRTLRGAGVRSVAPDGACFDIELISIHKDAQSQAIYLREIGATRRFDLAAGIFEANSLANGLKTKETPRPLTHAAMANTIRSLGGRLQDVLVYDVDENRTYYAYLRILQGSTLVRVEVRPSDALNLAVVCDVPILIAEAVFARTEELKKAQERNT